MKSLRFALAMLAVGGLAACGTGTGTVSSPPAVPFSTMVLSAGQERVATRVAEQEAAGNSPDSPGIVQPITSNVWPSYVTGVQAIANLTRAEAGKYTDSSDSDDTPVIVVRMTGHFAAMTTGPLTGTDTVAGTAMVVVADATSAQVFDAAIGAADTIAPLTNPDVLFLRKGSPR